MLGVRPCREGRWGNTEVRSRWAEAADRGSQRNRNPQRGQASGLLVEHPCSSPSRGAQLRLCAVPALPSFPDFPSRSLPSLLLHTTLLQYLLIPPTHTQRRKACEQRDTRSKKEVRAHRAERIVIDYSDESRRWWQAHGKRGRRWGGKTGKRFQTQEEPVFSKTLITTQILRITFRYLNVQLVLGEKKKKKKKIPRMVFDIFPFCIRH